MPGDPIQHVPRHRDPGPQWPLAARAFGLVGGDLEIRLDADRPSAITRVLTACLDGVAERAVWEWTLAERLQGLLAIATADEAPPPWHARCGRCAVAVEIEIAPQAFVAPPGRDAVACRAPDGAALTARLPRGSDQRAWRGIGADPRMMATSLVEDIDGQAPAPNWLIPLAWLDPLGEALAEADPLGVLQLHAGCPNCGHLNVIDFDLEGWLLGLFADRQNRLIDDVHRLAAFYHWSEAAICALPPWRRRGYLDRIARELPA